MIKDKFDIVMFAWLCFVLGYSIPSWIELTEQIWRDYVGNRKSKRVDGPKT